MNDLERMFYANTGNLIQKWKHISIFTIGIFRAFAAVTLRCWRRLWAKAVRCECGELFWATREGIISVDINPECVALAGDQIEIMLANQEERESLRGLKAKVPHVDILIDDGGATRCSCRSTRTKNCSARRCAWRLSVRKLAYVVLADWGGGFRRKDTFIGLGKRLVDQLHAWHSTKEGELRVRISRAQRIR